MKEITKYLNIILIIFITFVSQVESKILSIEILKQKLL